MGVGGNRVAWDGSEEGARKPAPIALSRKKKRLGGGFFLNPNACDWLYRFCLHLQGSVLVG